MAVKRSALLAIALLLTTLISLSSSSRPALAQDVETLFREGSEALSKKDFETAYDRLSKAWALRQTVDVAANLSVAERRTGRNRDAAEHLAFALAYFPPTGNQDVKRDLEATLTELKKGLAEVTVETEEGASIKLAGRVVGRAPMLSPVYLDPGTHTVGAEIGERKGSVTIKVVEGSSEKISIKLIDPSATEGPVEIKAKPKPAEPRPIWPAAVMGGVGGAALLVGVGLSIGAELERSSGEDLEETCIPVTESCRSEGQGKYDNWALFHNISFGMYGLAAAAGLGLGLYLGLPDEGATSSETVGFLPMLGPDVAGASVSGTF
jgi:hypothetical protein